MRGDLECGAASAGESIRRPIRLAQIDFRRPDAARRSVQIRDRPSTPGRRSDRRPDGRAAAILASEIQDGERLGSADDPGVGAAAFRADLALWAGGFRDGAPGLRTPFRLRFTHGGISSYRVRSAVYVHFCTPGVRPPRNWSHSLVIRRAGANSGCRYCTAEGGGVSMATNVGRLTIWSVITLLAIVVIALLVAHR